MIIYKQGDGMINKYLIIMVLSILLNTVIPYLHAEDYSEKYNKQDRPWIDEDSEGRRLGKANGLKQNTERFWYYGRFFGLALDVDYLMFYKVDVSSLNLPNKAKEGSKYLSNNNSMSYGLKLGGRIIDNNPFRLYLSYHSYIFEDNKQLEDPIHKNNDLYELNIPLAYYNSFKMLQNIGGIDIYYDFLSSDKNQYVIPYLGLGIYANKRRMSNKADYMTKILDSKGNETGVHNSIETQADDWLVVLYPTVGISFFQGYASLEYSYLLGLGDKSYGHKARAMINIPIISRSSNFNEILE
jgi:hypothetical protein